MDDELKKILSVDDSPAEGEKEKSEDTPENQQLKAEEERLRHLQGAIKESQDELKRIRKEKKALKSGDTEEEELPKIDMQDPGSKAWDKRIRETVEPVANTLEKEKEEVRNFALKEFLKDKPSLAQNPEKLKEVMRNYEALSQGRISERTREGVLDVLDSAYAATFHEALTSAARGRRVEQAEADAVFSDIAVTRGATGYSTQKDDTIKLSEDDKITIQKMGWSVQEWMEAKKKYG